MLVSSHNSSIPSKKAQKIGMVFYSSAMYQGHSLNSSLLQGPDLPNNLLGVLLRVRKRRVAITGDIEQIYIDVLYVPH